MLSPEGDSAETAESVGTAGESRSSKVKGSEELNSFKNPKTWKRTISNFFRNQLRSTKSNDGEGAKEAFDEQEISAEQKWQSLGKMFRRQSVASCGRKDLVSEAETSSHNKRVAVKKALSTYFGKAHRSNTHEK